jgi:hypothetical protein
MRPAFPCSTGFLKRTGASTDEPQLNYDAGNDKTGSQIRTAQLAFEWMALMNVYPVVLPVNYFFGSFWKQEETGQRFAIYV